MPADPTAPQPKPSSAPSPDPAGEVTFLFTDVEGSTLLWERHPEAMHRALARHDAILRAAVTERGGTVFNTVGDAVFAAFGAAGPAAEAALAAQRALLAEPWGPTGPLRVRMALHTGEPLARGGDYFGPPLNRCARLVATAHGGQLLVSRASAERLRAAGLPASAELRDLGAHRLRDLREPEQVFQLVAPGLPGEFPRLRSLDTLPNNLPMQLSTFVGRRRELAQVIALVEKGTRLLTLTGAGGSGKTRLALQVAADLADDYAEGAWLVELAPLADPDLVPQAVATALGLRESMRPRPRQGAPRAGEGSSWAIWLERLAGYLQGRQVLLVLDNCEHLVEACARLVEALLRGCPGLQVLATSREALEVAGEVVWQVPPLSMPEPGEASPAELLGFESVRLFVDRARAAQPGFALGPENAEAVAQICRRLDGIPLALELAAARLKTMSPAQVAARLDDRFRLLTGGSRTALARQQTLLAMMNWSYDLLDEDERAMLRRISVFGGGFTLEAVEAIAAGTGEPDPLALLDRLAAKSLLHMEEGDPPRYRLLETVRQYACGKLLESGEAAELRRRHGAWFLTLAEEAAAGIERREPEAGLDRLAAEHDNLRSALAWSLAGEEPETGLRLAGALWRFWFLRGFLSEGRVWIERALERTPERVPTGVLAQALLGAGALAWRQRDYARADEHLSRCLALYRQSGDPLGEARALHFLGRTAHFRGEHAWAMALYEESLALATALGDRREQAAALDVMGLLAWQQGDFARATALLEECLAASRALGDRHSMADALNILGRVMLDRGDFERAVDLFEESLEVYRALGDQVGLAYAWQKLGAAAYQQGDEARAMELLEASLARCRALGERRGEAYAADSLARIYHGRGDLARAASLYDEALGLARAIGDKRGVADALAGLGRLAADEGAPAAALDRGREALGLYVEMEDRLGIAEALDGLAAALVAGDPRRAARYLGAGEAQRERIGAPAPAPLAAARARDLRALRDGLGEAAFEAERAAGRAADWEAVLAEALTGGGGGALADPASPAASARTDNPWRPGSP